MIDLVRDKQELVGTLADLPNPPARRNSWGFHLLIDMSGCNDKMDNMAAVKDFFDVLIETLKMKKLTPIMVKRVSGEEGRGLSAVQMITTSSITFHGDDDKRCVYLDVFSCQNFKKKAVLDLVRKTFEPEHLASQMIYRDAGHQRGD